MYFVPSETGRGAVEGNQTCELAQDEPGRRFLAGIKHALVLRPIPTYYLFWLL
jgi:hypothetical protein